jgi:hypothetical protein
MTLSTQSGGGITSNGIYTFPMQAAPLTIAVNSYQNTDQLPMPLLVPNIPPITTAITSSNPGAGTITGSPVTLASSISPFSAAATANLFTVAPGQTTIAIAQPPGFKSVGNDHLTVQVVAPILSTSDVAAPKDTLAYGVVGLPSSQNARTTNSAVTLTSSDPSRVLLSPDVATPPSAEITVSIPVGSSTRRITCTRSATKAKCPLK